MESDDTKKPSKALVNARKKAATLAGDNAELAELVNDLAGVDVNDLDVDGVRKAAVMTRVGSTGARTIGAGVGGGLHGLGRFGKFGALVVGGLGKIGELCGLGDGKGFGRRVVNGAAAAGDGAVGATTSDAVKKLLSKSEDKEKI